MGIVSFRHPSQNLAISRSMFAPKRAAELKYWLKEARKMIPQIPKVGESGWEVAQEGASLDLVSFELHNPRIADKCFVTIQRRA